MNRFKNYVLMALGFVVALVAVGVFSAGPAIAQAVRAALVSNVDEPGRIPYRTELVFGGDDCATRLCFDAGRPVPAGKRLVITNVTGQVDSSVPAGAEFLLSFGNGLNGARIPVTFAGQSNAGNFFVFNQQVTAIFDAGFTPSARAFISAAGRIDAYVDVSGYLLDCTAAPCAAIVQ